MREIIGRLALTAVLVCAAALPADAATPSEFYTSLLRRGVAAHDAGNYPDAVRQLRFAAFGLVESIPDYQVAHVYLALTHSRNGDQTRAHDSAHRVVLAERVERRYAGLALPAGIRSAFDTLAARVLTPSDLSVLRATATAAAPPTGTPRGTSSVPAVPNTSSARQPQTSTSQPAPQTAAPQTTNPQTTPQQSTTQTSTATPPRTQPQQTTATQPQQQPRTTPAQPQTSTPPPVVVERVEVEPERATPPRTEPKPAPVQTQHTETPRTQPQAAQTQPAPALPRPAPATPTYTAAQVESRLTAAERALDSANLPEARRIYRELLAAPNVDRDTLIRTAEGLYRGRDFAGTVAGFERIGALRRGEEPYRYYIAVALYETGQYQRAKSELAAVLPYIEVTPDVARYRVKIEGAAR
ncbi:MAG TPA: tetratricopeptide repeat protein [Thermoanaerobaculia bacterium]|nr:tetratricopeptide repeat protein [Thermoanaerobaculia bacterium]